MNSQPAQPSSPDDTPRTSDWDDEDLLTVVEASQRLVDEIKASHERIRRAEEVLSDGWSAGDSAAVAGLEAERRRLAELIRAADRIKAAQPNAPR